MHSSAPFPRYVVVSPVKDEERYVELTIRSVIAQTVKPALWIIVDDGSSDRTRDLVAKYLDTHPFMRLVRHPHAGVRQPGSAVIRAFSWGCGFLDDCDYDFIVKLDCDLSFEPDYFERLLGRFGQDGSLGIASGVYLEKDKGGDWGEIPMPAYHAAGACKVVRRKCFEEIGSFVTSPGWDTVDEIRAMTRGWKTGHFSDLQMKHHKAEGSGIGSIKTSLMHGEIYYLTGGSKLFFLLKVLHRLGATPYGVNAGALAWGYARAMVARRVPLVTKAEARCYQTLLRERLQDQAKAFFTRNSVSLSR